MDRGAWQTTAHRVAQRLTQLKRLSARVHTHTRACAYHYINILATLQSI